MSDKQLKAWSFRLYTSKPGKLIPESKCNELMELIDQWAVKNDFEINSFKRPKYTLKELIDKCDPDAPPVEHDWKPFFDGFTGFSDDFLTDRGLPEYQERKSLLAELENIDLFNDMDLWEKVSQNIKDAITDTRKTRKNLSKTLDEMNNATEKAENSIDNMLSFVADSNKRIEQMGERLFDPAEHIEIDNPEFIQKYLKVMLDENGIEGLQRAFTHVSKALTLKEIKGILNIKGVVVTDEVLRKSIEDGRESQLIEESSDLPPDFIKGILTGLQEIKTGDVSAYKFGFDETEYLLSSPENAKRLNRSIEDVEKSLTEKHDLEELAELTNKAKTSTKRASESIEKGIDDAESFLKNRNNNSGIVGVTTVIEDGDDLVISLPPNILEGAGLNIGDEVKIELDKHGFVVTPVCKEVKNGK